MAIDLKWVKKKIELMSEIKPKEKKRFSFRKGEKTIRNSSQSNSKVRGLRMWLEFKLAAHMTICPHQYESFPLNLASVVLAGPARWLSG